MLSFAIEVRQLANQLGTMDKIASEIPSMEGCALAQKTMKKGASMLYDVIIKKASTESSQQFPKHLQVVYLINKLAGVLGKPELSPESNLEIASAVVADEALSEIATDATQEKLAEAQEFGREFFISLLRKVL